MNTAANIAMKPNPTVDVLGGFRAAIDRDLHLSERERCEADVNYFVEKCTRWPRADFHKRWSAFLNAQKQGLLLAPREHAKTSQITINEVAHKIIHNRDLRVLIVCETAQMAVRMGNRIRNIVTSPAVRKLWGDLEGQKWSETEFTLAGSSLDEKEASVTCIGAFGPVTSGHYDLVILDDAITMKNTRSQLQRDKLWDWFKFTLYPVVARGQLWILGTRYHYDDLYGRLMNRDFWASMMPAFIEQALIPDPAAAGGFRALWPEQYPVEALLELRKNLGTAAFNSQYQNDDAAMKGKFFKAEQIHYWKELPAGLVYTQGVDLAISKKTTADYFAHVTVGVDKQKNIFVKESFHDRLTFDGQFTAIKQRYRWHHRPAAPVVRVGIEANAYQAALAEKIRIETGLPVRKIVQNKDKVTRALWLQPLFENGKIFFPREGCEDLIDELLLFNEGPHDDLLDALVIAAQIAGAIGRRPASLSRKPRGF